MSHGIYKPISIYDVETICAMRHEYAMDCRNCRYYETKHCDTHKGNKSAVYHDGKSKTNHEGYFDPYIYHVNSTALKHAINAREFPTVIQLRETLKADD